MNFKRIFIVTIVAILFLALPVGNGSASETITNTDESHGTVYYQSEGE